MSPKRASLDLAAFLDSEQAGSLIGPSREQTRTIAEALLGICYDEFGKAPRFLQGEEIEQLVAQVLPTRFEPGSPVADNVPIVLTAFFEYLELNEVVTQIYEIKRALEASLPRFAEAVRSGAYRDQQVRKKSAPFIHGAEKLGRNDPCSCGSGKKFKKCHGKNA
ncbi:MAG: hypothetical protein ACI8TQ_003564 [Planctomycetota bacterium]|jgi:hypothetical protein